MKTARLGGAYLGVCIISLYARSFLTRGEGLGTRLILALDVNFFGLMSFLIDDLIPRNPDFLMLWWERQCNNSTKFPSCRISEG